VLYGIEMEKETRRWQSPFTGRKFLLLSKEHGTENENENEARFHEIDMVAF